MIALIIFILFLILLFFVGSCYHCKKSVWVWSEYYGQRTDIENMYLSKDKNFGGPYHKKCCHENEPLFESTEWINDDFKIL